MIKRTNTEGWMTTKAERRWYPVSIGAKELTNVLLASFLTTYLLMQGIKPELIAGAMLAVKIWDGLNDVIFGTVVDAVKFKKGKFIPWLKVGVFISPLSVILLFSIPEGVEVSMKVVFYVLAYMIMDLCATVYDVPSQGLLTTVTNNQKERVHYLNNGKMVGIIAAFAVYIIGVILVGENVGMSVSTYAYVSCLLAMILALPYVFIAKERVNVSTKDESGDKYSIKHMFGYMKANKYWLIYCLGYFARGGTYFTAGLAQFMSFYLFGSSMIAVPIMIVSIIPMVLIYIFLPYMLQKRDKIFWASWGNIISGTLSIITYFVGFGNILIYLVIYIVRVVFGSPSNHMMFMFAPDCIEYGKYKTGIDGRGITYATQALLFKLCSATASSLSMLLLGIFGWVEVTGSSFAELAASGIRQPDSAINGLWVLGTILPGIGLIASGIIYRFYQLKDNDVQIMSKCNSGEISKKEAALLLSREY